MNKESVSYIPKTGLEGSESKDYNILCKSGCLTNPALPFDQPSKWPRQGKNDLSLRILLAHT